MLGRKKREEPEVFVEGEFVNFKHILLNGNACKDSSEIEKFQRKEFQVKFDAASFSFVPKADPKTTIQLETKRFYIEFYAQKYHPVTKELCSSHTCKTVRRRSFWRCSMCLQLKPNYSSRR